MSRLIPYVPKPAKVRPMFAVRPEQRSCPWCARRVEDAPAATCPQPPCYRRSVYHARCYAEHSMEIHAIELVRAS